MSAAGQFLVFITLAGTITCYKKHAEAVN